MASDGLPLSTYTQWLTFTEECVVKSFGDSSTHHYTFLSSGPPGRMVVAYGGYDPDSPHEQSERRGHLSSKLETLGTLIQVLELEAELAGDLASDAPVGVLSTPQNLTGVFLVHGHDHAALHSVARFLEHLGLAPVVLHEQPNKGRTIIEKFIDHSQVGFAVVLLTPDDIGRSAKDAPSNERARARQNVILELGYFIGKIGRDKVCPLYVNGVEIPSDYLGTAFTQMDDSGAWKLTLARELKAAGFAIDLNKAM